MEPSSENRRRGRPRAFSEKELSDAEERAVLSARHRQNRAYAERARRRLAGLGWWEELYEEGSPVSKCALTELGRIKDDARFGEAAWWYWHSGRGLSAKTAASRLRQMRLGVIPQAGPTMLCERLLRTMDDFRSSHPNASLLYVEAQVEIALETVRRLRQYRH